MSERRKIFSKTPKKSEFELEVIGVESIDRTNPRGPTKLEERILHSRGLGAQRVAFLDSDPPSVVNFRIKQYVLKTIC